MIALPANTQRQLEATLSRALAKNDKFFQQEREKLDATTLFTIPWAAVLYVDKIE